jgi:hypothetical protein
MVVDVAVVVVAVTAVVAAVIAITIASNANHAGNTITRIKLDTALRSLGAVSVLKRGYLRKMFPETQRRRESFLKTRQRFAPLREKGSSISSLQA